MAYLIIDAGNTRVKVFVFEEDKAVFDAAFQGVGLKEKILKIFKDFQISKTLLSSVGGGQDNISEILNTIGDFTMLSHETKVPFINLYGTL